MQQRQVALGVGPPRFGKAENVAQKQLRTARRSELDDSDRFGATGVLDGVSGGARRVMPPTRLRIVIPYDRLSWHMSNRALPTLLRAHAELGQSRILDAVMAVLDDPDGNALTVREVARRARVSERTVFRHYASRSDLARAAEPRVQQRLARLVPPATLDELFGYAEVLFPVLDENQHLVRSLLGSEFGRELLSNERRRRLANLQRLLRAAAPDASKAAVESAATSIRLLLSGTSWRFHRDECGLSLKQTIAHVSRSVRALVEQLNAREGSPSAAVS